MLKNLLLLSGFSTFAVIVIISFNIYHNHTLSSLPDVTQQRVVAIPSTFDKQTLMELRKRTPISVSLFDKTEVVSEDAKDTPITQTPTPSITTTQTISSGSATPL